MPVIMFGWSWRAGGQDTRTYVGSTRRSRVQVAVSRRGTRSINAGLARLQGAEGPDGRTDGRTLDHDKAAPRRAASRMALSLSLSLSNRLTCPFLADRPSPRAVPR